MLSLQIKLMWAHLWKGLLHNVENWKGLLLEPMLANVQQQTKQWIFYTVNKSEWLKIRSKLAKLKMRISGWNDHFLISERYQHLQFLEDLKLQFRF